MRIRATLAALVALAVLGVVYDASAQLRTGSCAGAEGNDTISPGGIKWMTGAGGTARVMCVKGDGAWFVYDNNGDAVTWDVYGCAGGQSAATCDAPSFGAPVTGATTDSQGSLAAGCYRWVPSAPSTNGCVEFRGY
jgi:hypothetical protein